MRRLARCLLNTTTALSLLLCVAALVIWDRDLKSWARERQQLALRLKSMEDEFFAVRMRPSIFGSGPDHPPDGDIPPEIMRLRARLAAPPPPPNVEGLLCAACVLAIPPAAWVACLCWSGHKRTMRAKRTTRDRCPSCSYDLTGNVSGTCPECGTTTGVR